MQWHAVLIRLVGIWICLKGYYSVFANHKLIMFKTVVVDDWTMYLLPLVGPFVAEWCIIAIASSKKEIERQKHSK